jgi:hypothetical protein
MTRADVTVIYLRLQQPFHLRSLPRYFRTNMAALRSFRSRWCVIPLSAAFLSRSAGLIPATMRNCRHGSEWLSSQL